jgi:ABC-type antimicrobial peptide transport system permease subunit
MVKFQTFRAQISDRFDDDRMLARLTMLFGLLALSLATLGIYGITAYAVERRTAEIGIRMALGAERSEVMRMILRDATVQVVVGLALGVPAALSGFRLVAAQLYQIKSIDAWLWLVSVLTLILAAILAGAIPARRAATIDPVRALRAE